MENDYRSWLEAFVGLLCVFGGLAAYVAVFFGGKKAKWPAVAMVTMTLLAAYYLLNN